MCAVKTSGKHSLLPRKVTLQWFSGGPNKFGVGMYRDSSCRVDDASLCSVRSLNTTGGVHRASACLVYGVSFSRVRGGSASIEVHRDSTRQSATPAYLLWLSCVSSAIATTSAVFNAPAPVVHAAPAPMAELALVRYLACPWRQLEPCTQHQRLWRSTPRDSGGEHH